MTKGKWISFVLAWVTLLLGVHALAQTPTAPGQPTSGPGGSNYINGIITNGPYWANNRTLQDQYKYYIYEPASPTPADAPVILFLHGFLAGTPSHYQAWLNHMVRKGYIVVWVEYQMGIFTPVKNFAPNAQAAWEDALYRLQHFWWEKHVTPRLDAHGQIETIFVGHSLGGWLSAVIAAGAKQAVPPIPVPYGMVLIEPASKGLVPGADFSLIDPNTKMVEVAGDADTIACKTNTVSIWNTTPQIAAANKNVLLAITDKTGIPQQIADHFFPNTDGFGTTSDIDARDFFITWKLSVALADCALNNNSANDPNACDYALGAGSTNQVFMGLWSNGTPLNPMVFYSNPNTMTPTPGCKGL